MNKGCDFNWLNIPLKMVKGSLIVLILNILYNSFLTSTPNWDYTKMIGIFCGFFIIISFLVLIIYGVYIGKKVENGATIEDILGEETINQIKSGDIKDGEEMLRRIKYDIEKIKRIQDFDNENTNE